MVVTEEQRYELGVGLSNDQTDALVMIINFLSIKGPDIFVLKGYAGTGKTFLVGKLIEYIEGKVNNPKIAITAPTNKAVEVLSSGKDYVSKNISYRTIHSLMGLTEEIQDDGTITFSNRNRGTCEINSFKYLIIDEGSMLHDDLFNRVRIYSEKVKIIIMGDPAQIPPVGKKDCIPFKECLSTVFEEGYTLREIMRQAKGNPLIEAASMIRDNLGKEQPIQDLQGRYNPNLGSGIYFIDYFTGKEELKMRMTALFKTSNFDDDSNYVKVIAWTNKTVNYINVYIRTSLFGINSNERVLVGERFIVNKPVFEDEDRIVFNTSEEFTVTAVDIDSKKHYINGCVLVSKFYNCAVMGKYKMSKGLKKRVKILHPECYIAYDKFLNELKKKAIDAKKGIHWIQYYQATRIFADVSYNYAITAHKAQGSTYENVFVMEDDIDLNKDVVERNRIKYTAYTRASRRLYVFKKLKPTKTIENKQESQSHSS